MVFQLNCLPCSAADSARDIVKFDFSLIDQKDKDNISNNASATQGMEQCETVTACSEEASASGNDAPEVEQEPNLVADHLASDIVRRDQEERDMRELAELREAERLQQEAVLREKEEASARAAAADVESSWQDQLREAAAVAEQNRQNRAAAEADERLQKEKEAALQKAQAYLAANRFDDVNALRKSTWKAKRPLHSAIKAKDAEVVRCLLLAGADPTLTNSAGQTAWQVAKALNKKGSHAAILAALPEPPTA